MYRPPQAKFMALGGFSKLTGRQNTSSDLEAMTVDLEIVGSVSPSPQWVHMAEPLGSLRP